jgi:hypothetical protein
MKRLVIIFSALVALAACQGNSQDKSAGFTVDSKTTSTQSASAADASTDPSTYTTVQWIDSAKDFGQITEGQKLEVAFRFKNSGNKPLIIQSVQPSCGCTVADYPKEPIAPGKEGVIKGVFDSAGKPGVNTKTMTVLANTQGTTAHHLSFTVNVQKKAS